MNYNMEFVCPFYLFKRGDRVAVCGDKIICDVFAQQIKHVNYISLVKVVYNNYTILGNFVYDAILLAFEREDVASHAKKILIDQGIEPSIIRWGRFYRWEQFFSLVFTPMLDRIERPWIPPRTVGKEERNILPWWFDSSLVDPIEPCPSSYTGNRKTRILLDVSRTYKSDSRTGIQRVVRGIAKAASQCSYPVEIVYSTLEDPAFYRADKVIGCENSRIKVDPMPGDILLFLDLWPEHVIHYRHRQAELLKKGVRVFYFVYDLTPLAMPQNCSKHLQDTFGKYFTVVLQSRGVVCDSKTTMLDVQRCIEGTMLYRSPFSMGYIHLGSDVEETIPTKGIPQESRSLLQEMKKRKTFLMVGTIDPHKGHRFVLDVMEKLWQEGLDWNLVIVGRQGWNMDDFIHRLSSHPEIEKRLFILGHISDEYLELVYTHSDCLIAASEAEGFGLPLVEAARHGIPVLARDIPIFREVGGEHVMYFDGSDLESAKRGFHDCAVACLSGTMPDSKKMRQLTWKESAEWLLDVLLHEKWEQVLE